MARQKISSSPKIKSSFLPPSQSSDSAVEKAIAKTIDSIRRSLNPYYDTITSEEQAAAVIKISEATQKHFELQIRTLQQAPRGPDKLRELLKVKQKEYEKATDSQDIERLVTEIDMLEYVLFLVRKHGRNSSISS